MTQYIDIVRDAGEVLVRIYCKECGEKARISSRDEVSPLFARLYCQCLNVKGCGHRFVMTLAFSHALVPAAEPIDRMLFDRLHALPRKQQREMFEQLGILSA